MNEDALRRHLKKKRKSESTIERSLEYTSLFSGFLEEFRGGKKVEESEPADLEEFVSWLEENDQSPNAVLWGVRFCFEFVGSKEMVKKAAELRERRIERKAFLLADFRGVSPRHAERLSTMGIESVSQMLEAGRSNALRKTLAKKSQIPIGIIEELALLSDMARIPGLKAIRARLYYDAGVDTLDKLAAWDPDKLRAMLIEFIETSGFDGVAPWPKETTGAVESARRLPRILEF
jgi:hypothetical protein